jgi:hypothetical protein
MPLVDVPVSAGPPALPAEVRRFLRDADARVERLDRRGHVSAFVPSDYPAAYRALRAVAAGMLAPGTRFCEWGSGLGVVAGLAALAGFEATGIEIDGELVREARELAADHDLAVEFAHGSFIPRAAERRVTAAGVYAWLTTEGDDAYDDLGLELTDLDVVYAYPWPDEEEVTADLFARYACPGALLLTYHGGDGVRARRKVGRR